MSTEVRIPSLGFGNTEGTLVEWLIEDGKEVSEGQPLFVLELDKATEEVVAPASGTLKVITAAGETCEIGALIGEIA